VLFDCGEEGEREGKRRKRSKCFEMSRETVLYSYSNP
jgi:hypothetical protein